ncbi:tRNA 2-thiouridine(34) synthase MnmA [Desulfosarcina sp. OttesenSCG-928-A07]|nr:tRNA 2-thiouridine(34) synthase MnmA [Desulfosarcina sp. OttesenSCG-928-A07]
MTNPVAIAVSGGVDSLVAAYLLKQHHGDVIGLHFLTGYEDPSESLAAAVADRFAQMDIPIIIVDLCAAFKTHVVNYFVAAYRGGQTPNPCLVCNVRIKFGALLDAAQKHGASRLATGHYACITKDPCGRYGLKKGIDTAKDQSYFLSRLTSDQLSRACFPLGTWTKGRVRALAAEKKLFPVTRKESQDVCFIRDGNYAHFLEKEAGIPAIPGDIVTVRGDFVGRHKGLYHYTIGQRRGINCPAARAYYVIDLNPLENQLIVGHTEDLQAAGCQVADINWISGVPEKAVTALVRLRYRHTAVPATLMPMGENSAQVWFDTPQNAVTPGQAAVFYREEAVLGSGWIVSSFKDPCPGSGPR